MTGPSAAEEPWASIEAQAVSRLRRQDMSGLEPLVKAYQAQAVQAAYLVTHDRPLAEDVAQAAFLRALGGIQRFDPRRPFRPWLMRIVVNTALDAVRHEAGARRTQGDSPIDPAFLDLVADPAPGPEAAAEEADLRAALLSALKTLPPAQRAAVVMRYFLGLGESEMAHQMSIPPGTVKWRLHSARRRLRKLLREWGGASH